MTASTRTTHPQRPRRDGTTAAGRQWVAGGGSAVPRSPGLVVGRCPGTVPSAEAFLRAPASHAKRRPATSSPTTVLVCSGGEAGVRPPVSGDSDDGLVMTLDRELARVG